MEMKDFFIFGGKFVLSTFQASPMDLSIDKFKLFKGDYTGIGFPVIFKQEGGKKFHDILDTGFVSLFLISDRMKTILEESGLTGWRSFPIKLYDNKKNEITGYHGFSVIGRCQAINFKNSEIIEKQFVPTGPICKYYKGIFIENWDGSDFFSLEKMAYIFITKKAADLLKENKITNMRLRNCTEYESSVRNIGKN